MTYQGIKLNQDMLNFISTYHILDRDNLVQYLDDDKVFQKMIQRHILERKLYILMFNLSPYLLALILIKG